ncbi:hypothetical protein CEXT_6851 [Caerostris extrusa]|uniref:Uncharacterized protein n=1 Tax=Caerostris extrusa TaxID=172846 RepID=A0AAV4X9Z5_CAEEX|nr:hypothetical protein CEXT_6851 [Caerostris extrusa]
MGEYSTLNSDPTRGGQVPVDEERRKRTAGGQRERSEIGQAASSSERISRSEVALLLQPFIRVIPRSHWNLSSNLETPSLIKRNGLWEGD